MINKDCQPSGWYPAQRDPPETHRYWDGAQWQGAAEPIAPVGERGSTGVTTAMPAGLEAGGPWRRIAGKVIDQVLLVAAVYVSAYSLNSMNVSSRAAWAAFWFACFWLVILYNLVLVGLFTPSSAPVSCRSVWSPCRSEHTTFRALDLPS